MKGKLVAMILAAVIGVPTLSAFAWFTPGTPAVSSDVPETLQQPDLAALAIQDAVAREADLQQACADDGPDLAAKEAAGTVTPLEQAALDALRPICADTDNPLPAAVATEQPVQVVTIVETVSAAPAPASDHESEDESEHEEREEVHEAEQGDD